MSNVSTDRRLRLIQKIRQEQNQNRQAIKTREHILYGKALDTPPDFPVYERENDPEKEGGTGENVMPSSSFGIRMMIALLLFGGYFFLAKNQGNIGGVNADMIRGEINRYSSMSVNLFDFIDDITYTLNINEKQKE